MKKRKYQRKLPGRGNHLGLFIKETYSTEKVSDPDKMEAALKELLLFDPEPMLSECEQFFIELLDDLKTITCDPKIMFRASKILEYCDSLRRAIENVNVSEIVRRSMFLQHHITAYQLIPWERPARVGEERSKIMKKAAIKGARLRKENKETQARDDEIVKLFKSGIETSKIAKRKKLSISQVQRIVKPHR